MLSTLSVVGAYFAELVIAYLFFLQQSVEQQPKHRVRWGMGIGMFGLGMTFYFLFKNFWVNTVVDFLITLLFARFAFRLSWPRAAFGSLILHALSVLTELLAMLALGRIMPVDLNVMLAQPAYAALMMAISKTLFFTVTVPLARLTAQKGETAVRIPVAFYLYPLTGSLSNSVIACICAAYGVTGTYLVAVLVLSVLMTVSAFLIFVTYQSQAQREKQLHILERQNEKERTDRTYYDILEKQNADLMVYAHDAKKHLAAIRELNQNPQIETYLSTMTEQLRQYSSIGHSGNRMLDIVCNKYVTECASKKISFDMDIRLANFHYMEYFDLVTLFGNMLDNAVEAAACSVEKRISLYTDHCNTYDVIVLTNSCDKAPISNGRKLATTKENPALHGMGMESFGRILKKYGGDYDWEYDARAREFTLTAMVLPPKSERSLAV